VTADIDTLLAAADELTDPRRHVEVPEHQCLTCPHLHHNKPRIYARAQVCDRCRLHLADMLTAVPDLYHRLPEHLERGTSVWERVSGGDTEAPLPFVEDVWDLLLPYRAKLTGEDQVGYLSVITVVTTWTRDWATYRAKRELGAVVTVTDHVRWLADRLDWACDDHPAVDEFAAELRTLTRAMRRHVGPETSRPQPCVGVPCRRCDWKSLARLADGSGDVECQNPACRTIYRPAEYTRWVGLLAAALERA
jgi:hypothetical protein